MTSTDAGRITPKLVFLSLKSEMDAEKLQKSGALGARVTHSRSKVGKTGKKMLSKVVQKNILRQQNRIKEQHTA
jgi:hypothetical protein